LKNDLKIALLEKVYEKTSVARAILYFKIIMLD
jgi:hypothetical protein